ncbi:MAG TPA: response regulator transcription factor, partial [Rhizomicrobium sp.]|nr:response regulator transcription factor [Rhizomicrobium sp.]
FARHFDYDAIILDLNLPDMSGFEVLRALRRANIGTPVIILSGSVAIDSKVKALNHGADDYMTKPFSNEELVGRLRALVRRSKGYSDSRISFGPMTLDLVAKTVETHGRRVHLSGKEYQILELLSLRRGVAVSKETLINHIYSDGEGPDSPTIGLFMYRLRKKLAAASGGAQYIETVRDQGYLMPRAARSAA